MRKQKENRLVVADIGWAETIPDWLKKEVELERMLYTLSSLMKGGKTKVGDAEVCVYLYTHSLRAPLSSEFVNIYMYLGTQLFKKQGQEVPEQIKKEKLDEYEKECLERLREDIYRARGREISHPLFDVLRQVKKDIQKKAKKGAKNG